MYSKPASCSKIVFNSCVSVDFIAFKAEVEFTGLFSEVVNSTPGSRAMMAA